MRSGARSLRPAVPCFSLLASLLLLFCLLPSPSAASSDWSYQGCYADEPDIQRRALPYYQDQAKDMTVDKCLSECASHGYPYAGLEFKYECYCSKRPPTLPKVSDDKCDIPCGKADGDDRPCGGSAVVSVYHNAAVKEPVSTRPLVCLVMILKDEAHTIMDTLQTVKDHIDCWYILDTGSKDGTQKKITDFFANHRSPLFPNGAIPGKLFEEPFLDYGATRNRILDLAKQTANPVFTLMLSADERVSNPQTMREFLQDMRHAHGTMHNAYPVVMNTGIKFDSIRLARVDGGWRYRARVHEYLAPATGPYVALYRSEKDLEVLFNATDGDRRYKSQWFIKKLLEEDLEKDPNDTRSIYYLARTNSGINNHTAAYYYYDLLAKRSKWDEEVYHGLTMKAIEAKFIDTIGWKERQTMFVDAINYKPVSMDAMHSLAQDHFDSGRFHLAYLFIHRAVHLTPPAGLITVENVLLRPTQYLYDYEGHRLMGFAAREIGEWDQCVRSFLHVLRVQPTDDIVKGRVKLCEDKLKEQGLPVPTQASIAAQEAGQPVTRQGADGVVERVVEKIVEKVVYQDKPCPAPGAQAQADVQDVQTNWSQQSAGGGGWWDSVAWAFSWQVGLNVAGVLVFALAAVVFASKKYCRKKLKD